MSKPDLLTKAKALAILQHPDFDALWEDEIEEGWTATAAGPASSVADSPLKALALLADALGLEPDHAVVVLTEEEKATVNDALLYYQNIALEHAVDQERRGYVESAEVWRRTAEQAESLRQRLAE